MEVKWRHLRSARDVPCARCLSGVRETGGRVVKRVVGLLNGFLVPRSLRRGLGLLESRNLGLKLGQSGDSGILLGTCRFRRVNLREEGGNLEHFTSSLAVGGRDARGVDVEEVVLLEKPVRGEGESVADPGDGRNDVAPGAKVSDRTEELQGVAALGERVFARVDLSEEGDCLRGEEYSMALKG